MSKEGVLSVNTSGAAVVETLSSEGGPPTPPDGHNFNFSGSIAGGSAANGAIEFITPGGPGATTDGQMDAVVRTDGVTIHINASNDLEVIGGVFSEKFTVDAFTAPGTNPVVPDGSGNVNITGAQVAAGVVGTNVIRTDSLAANSYTIEIQRSQAVASSTIADNGVSHFDSADFTVDANGFVSLVGGTAIETINGDIGSISGTTVTIFANQATLNSGSSVFFNNSGTISTLNVTDANSNTIVGLNAGNGAISGTGNTGLGKLVFGGLGAGINSTAIGYSALAGLGGNEGSTAVGYNAILAMFGQRNTAVGEFSLGGAGGASGSYNTAVGYNTGVNLTSGSQNLIMGTAGTVGSGSQYTSSESSNILLNNAGVTGESNVMRLGTQGSGGGQVNSTFVAGIVGVSVANQQQVVIDSTSGELGVASGSFSTAYTDVTFVMSPYTVLATDQYISCDTSGGAITLNFPNAPTAFQTWVVKDRTGNSAVNNVTITTPGGVVTFDGAATLLLNTAYAAVNLLANATPTYEVY